MVESRIKQISNIWGLERERGGGVKLSHCPEDTGKSWFPADT